MNAWEFVTLRLWSIYVRRTIIPFYIGRRSGTVCFVKPNLRMIAAPSTLLSELIEIVTAQGGRIKPGVPRRWAPSARMPPAPSGRPPGAASPSANVLTRPRRPSIGLLPHSAAAAFSIITDEGGRRPRAALVESGGNLLKLRPRQSQYQCFATSGESANA